jgi:hypothetical protein
MPRRFVAYFLCVLLGTSTTGGTKKEKQTEFGTGLETGFALAHYHETCVDFRVFFIPAQFFKGLEQIQTTEGIRFQRGHESFRSFPEKLIVDIQATAFGCSGMGDSPLPPKTYGVGLLDTLAFKLNWKAEDSGMTAASVISTQSRHSRSGVRWDYFVEVSCSDIPLTNSLAIEIVARDHLHLAEVVADFK